METESKEAVLMTAEEKAAFEAFKQAQEKENSKKRAQSEREQYRQLVNDEVVKSIPRLLAVSRALTKNKERVFDNFSAILDMKSDVMKLTRDNQKTHTFTDAEGKYRLTLGMYMLDGYDDTVEDGIAMVKEYITSLASDEKTKGLVEMVLKLLSKDTQGNLKASRVMQLRKLANESGNDRFVEGVHIIEESYRPTPSKTFLRAEERDKNNKWKAIPLGMTES
ncbi:DUF3164 family protein [Viscerimonas tarda]